MAVFSIVRDRYMGFFAKLAWILVAFVLPIIGPILWFTIGKRYSYGPSGGNG
ncbi:PLD nuclease N-terminal domain-containing protein [Rhodococcus sp. EPR-147]|nr:PLD nuclease N-terminal domain-containing protein [Rhodococcus sp. EPR-147]